MSKLQREPSQVGRRGNLKSRGKCFFCAGHCCTYRPRNTEQRTPQNTQLAKVSFRCDDLLSNNSVITTSFTEHKEILVRMCYNCMWRMQWGKSVASHFYESDLEFLSNIFLFNKPFRSLLLKPASVSSHFYSYFFTDNPLIELSWLIFWWATQIHFFQQAFCVVGSACYSIPFQVFLS